MPVIELVQSADTPLALRRLSPGTSLGDVHRGTGISHSHLSRIFNGRRTPSLKVALVIANFLQVTVDDVTEAVMLTQSSQPSRMSKVASRLRGLTVTEAA